MNRSNNPNLPSNPESENQTSLRFSLANENIGSKDIIIGHPSRPWRAVEYPTSDSEQLEIRDKLYAQGLILGRLITENSDDTQCYGVPTSARPLAYESSAAKEGSFTYNDPKLYEDLGELLALTSLTAELKWIIRGDIGRAVALVDFTQPNERRLLLIPGIEKLLKPREKEQDLESYYEDRISHQFGYRFARAPSIVANSFHRTMDEFKRTPDA